MLALQRSHDPQHATRDLVRQRPVPRVAGPGPCREKRERGVQPVGARLRVVPGVEVDHRAVVVERVVVRLVARAEHEHRVPHAHHGAVL